MKRDLGGNKNSSWKSEYLVAYLNLEEKSSGPFFFFFNRVLIRDFLGFLKQMIDNLLLDPLRTCCCLCFDEQP